MECGTKNGCLNEQDERKSARKLPEIKKFRVKNLAGNWPKYEGLTDFFLILIFGPARGEIIYSKRVVFDTAAQFQLVFDTACQW